MEIGTNEEGFIDYIEWEYDNKAQTVINTEKQHNQAYNDKSEDSKSNSGESSDNSNSDNNFNSNSNTTNQSNNTNNTNNRNTGATDVGNNSSSSGTSLDSVTKDYYINYFLKGLPKIKQFIELRLQDYNNRKHIKHLIYTIPIFFT